MIEKKENEKKFLMLTLLKNNVAYLIFITKLANEAQIHQHW